MNFLLVFNRESEFAPFHSIFLVFSNKNFRNGLSKEKQFRRAAGKGVINVNLKNVQTRLCEFSNPFLRVTYFVQVGPRNEIPIIFFCSEIVQSDWLNLVTWLATSNQRALVHGRVVMLI